MLKNNIPTLYHDQIIDFILKSKQRGDVVLGSSNTVSQPFVSHSIVNNY